MKKRVYLSGKISGLDESTYSTLFVRAQVEVNISHGFRVNEIINPVRIKPLFGIKRWFFYMVKDLYILSHCTHIAMLPNWTDSRGACIEHFFAKFVFKIDVIYL